MDATIAGLLIVTSTLAGSPAVQLVDPQTAPATTMTLRHAAARPNFGDTVPVAGQPSQQPRARRFSKVERAIAIGAGSVIGFYAGAVVGWKATDNPSNPNDDTSGLRGVVIGAPLGAAVGGILGFVLTR